MQLYIKMHIGRSIKYFVYEHATLIFCKHVVRETDRQTDRDRDIDREREREKTNKLRSQNFITQGLRF